MSTKMSPVSQVRPSRIAAYWVPFILIAGFISLLSWDFRASDDNLWLYFTSQKLFQAGAVQSEQDLIEGMRHIGYSSDLLRRLEMRRDYSQNYWLASLGYGIAAKAIQTVNPELMSQDYPAYVLTCLLTGFSLTALASFLVLTVIVSVLPISSTLRLALPFSLSLMLILMHRPVPPFILTGSFWEIAGHTLQFAINPGPQFSLFGFTPRNQFAVLLTGVFLLRWSGRYLPSYWAMPVLAFLHQSHTSFALALVIFIDLLFRPMIFKEKRLWICLVLLVGLAMLRETLWRYINLTSAGILLLASASVVTAWWGRCYWMRCGLQIVDVLRKRYGIVGEIVSKLGPIGSDLIAILVFLIFTILLTSTSQRWVDPFAYTYFWGQLPTRSLSFLQGPLFLGLTTLLVGQFSQRHNYWARYSLVTAGILLGSLVLAQLIQFDQSFYQSVMNDLRKLNSELSSSTPYHVPPTNAAEEDLWYYALAKQTDTGQVQIKKFLSGSDIH